MSHEHIVKLPYTYLTAMGWLHRIDEKYSLFRHENAWYIRGICDEAQSQSGYPISSLRRFTVRGIGEFLRARRAELETKSKAAANEKATNDEKGRLDHTELLSKIAAEETADANALAAHGIELSAIRALVRSNSRLRPLSRAHRRHAARLASATGLQIVPAIRLTVVGYHPELAIVLDGRVIPITTPRGASAIRLV